MSNQQNNKILTEGLRPNDLKDLVHPIFEVDTFKSKMGEDKDVVVISFQVKDRYPAKDLMEFVEKGYSFVLDADISSGENENGEYSVFIELPRTKKIHEHIKDITYGLNKLTGIDDWKFKYYKDQRINEADTENLKAKIPSSPIDYEREMNRFQTEDIKKFFNKTLMDDLELNNDVITIYKPFNKSIKLRWIKNSEDNSILESSPAVDDNSTAEIFWMTKVLGDYDISKFGDTFLFTNGNQKMILKRID